MTSWRSNRSTEEVCKANLRQDTNLKIKIPCGSRVTSVAQHEIANQIGDFQGFLSTMSSFLRILCNDSVENKFAAMLNPYDHVVYMSCLCQQQSIAVDRRSSARFACRTSVSLFIFRNARFVRPKRHEIVRETPRRRKWFDPASKVGPMSSLARSTTFL